MGKALILDCDGVLAETQAAHISCANAAFVDTELSLTWDEALFARLSQTAGVRHQAEAYFGRFGWPGGEAGNHELLGRIEEAHRKEFVRLARDGEIPLREDVGDLIDFASAAGWAVAVCTDDHADLASVCVSRLGLKRASMVQLVVSGRDVERQRPDGAVYRHAAERLGLAPSDCTAVIARPFGALAAKSAGLAFIALPGVGVNPLSFAGGRVVEALSPEGLGLAA
jgi:beta-phosphoglucomutase-like phosphatase (HAD superfamily)